VEPDGKIVGAGWEYVLTQPYADAIVVFRLNEDGSMDRGFGPAGTGRATISNGYDGATVLVQPSGEIFVVGTLFNPSAGVPPTALLARYKADGSLDSSFGNLGVVTRRVHDQDSSHSGAAVQPNGKIVVSVEPTPPPQRGPLLPGTTATGSDPTPHFGTSGVFSGRALLFGFPQCVELNHDGTVLAVGNVHDDASGGNGSPIVRLTSSGGLGCELWSWRKIDPIDRGWRRDKLRFRSGRHHST
jgi:uncharacterized delta-60 repeat protein